MIASGASPTWGEARSFLRERFALAKDSEDLAVLAFGIPWEGQEIRQWVRVSPVSVHGEPWLTVLSDICPQSTLAPARAFELLNQIPFGGLWAVNGVYLFRHSLSLENLALPQLEHAVRLVAYEALRLRVAVTPPAAQEAVLGHYEE